MFIAGVNDNGLSTGDETVAKASASRKSLKSKISYQTLFEIVRKTLGSICENWKDREQIEHVPYYQLYSLVITAGD